MHACFTPDFATQRNTASQRHYPSIHSLDFMCSVDTPTRSYISRELQKCIQQRKENQRVVMRYPLDDGPSHSHFYDGQHALSLHASPYRGSFG